MNWVDGASGGFGGATLPPIGAFGGRRLPVDYIIILTELMFSSDKEAAAPLHSKDAGVRVGVYMRRTRNQRLNS